MSERNLNTIYLVEDDLAVIDALQVFIDSMNSDLTLELFSTASQFINYMGDSGLSKSALLIIDYRLPGMNGLELVKKLSDEGVQVPKVMMTGHADMALAQKAREFGVINLLAKPFNPTLLKETICDVFGLALDTVKSSP